MRSTRRRLAWKEARRRAACLAWLASVALLAALLVAAPARAYGPEGHLIAGALAQPLLCRPAATEVGSLSGGRSLGEIGLWADRVRDRKEWRRTAPWHYMNIEDGAAIADFRHPPEGDVLWAIEHFRAALASAHSGSGRLEALRFLVHFVVDVHQPLHVGRASDRGGNTVDVRYAGSKVSLHRFWDTDVLHVAGLSRAQYVAALEPLVAVLAAPPRQATGPAAWAAESLALRPWVYAFGRSRTLDRAYLDRADEITRLRLAQAAVRLAATLNSVLGCATK